MFQFLLCKLVKFTVRCGVLAQWQSTNMLSQLLPIYSHSHQYFIPKETSLTCPADQAACVPLHPYSLSSADLKCTSSLRNTDKLLASQCSARHNADGQLSFLLHTITGLLWPSLTHYYGFICHLTPTCILSLLLMDASGVCPDVVPGFPSYCTGSLLTMPPSITVWG